MKERFSTIGQLLSWADYCVAVRYELSILKSVAVNALLRALKQFHGVMTVDGLTHFLGIIMNPLITVHRRTAILLLRSGQI